jgi:hypothetical protein
MPFAIYHSQNVCADEKALFSKIRIGQLVATATVISAGNNF